LSVAGQREHGVVRALWDLLRRPVPPEHRSDLFFGWALLSLFLVQVATGILLSIYYEPSPAAVAESVQFLMRDVDWGWLVRGVHHWASHALIILAALHLVWLFVRGRYRGPGAPNWYVGALVLGLAVSLTYSGGILAWDQETYWQVTRALSGLESFGSPGSALAHVLRGGDEVSATTLSRTYTLHGMFLPWLSFVLLVANLWFLGRRIHDARGGVA
jgi:quinol-cytochrome oxidoreductase complex cytochrome b subunit